MSSIEIQALFKRRGMRELLLIVLLALTTALVVSVTGILEPLLLLVGASLPLHGAITAGGAVLIIGIAIFAIRRWRDALRAQQEYRDMFDRSPSAFFQATPDGQILRANRALTEMLGFETVEELLASNQAKQHQLYKDDSQREQFVQALVRTGVLRNFEAQLSRPNGKTIWVLGNSRAVCDRKGNLLYFEGNVLDITARKEAEDAYRKLVDQSLQGIVIFQYGHIVFGNRAAADLFGVTPERMLALSPSQIEALIHPNDRSDVIERLHARMLGKNVPSRLVFQILRPAGEHRWVEVAANALDYRGEPAALVTIADVTERMQAQDAMDESMRRSRLRDELTAALVQSGNDVDKVAGTLARVVSRVMNGGCTVSLVSADGHYLDPRASVRTETGLDGSHRAIYEMRLALDHPLLEHLMQGQPHIVAVGDSEATRGMHLSPSAEDDSTTQPTNYLAVPLRHGADIQGVVWVARAANAPALTARDQQLAQEFADRGALAIANAQLVAQLLQQLAVRESSDSALDLNRALDGYLSGDPLAWYAKPDA